MENNYPINLKLVSFTLVFILIFSACASTTYIDSNPSGAYLYLDGKAVGITPYSMTDKKTIFSCTSVNIEKEGYMPYSTMICRDEEFDAGAFIAGYFLIFPLFWMLKYKPSRTYKLISENDSDHILKIESKARKEKSGFDKLIEETMKDE